MLKPYGAYKYGETYEVENNEAFVLTDGGYATTDLTAVVETSKKVDKKPKKRINTRAMNAGKSKLYRTK